MDPGRKIMVMAGLFLLWVTLYDNDTLYSGPSKMAEVEHLEVRRHQAPCYPMSDAICRDGISITAKLSIGGELYVRDQNGNYALDLGDDVTGIPSVVSVDKLLEEAKYQVRR